MEAVPTLEVQFRVVVEHPNVITSSQEHILQ